MNEAGAVGLERALPVSGAVQGAALLLVEVLNESIKADLEDPFHGYAGVVVVNLKRHLNKREAFIREVVIGGFHLEAPVIRATKRTPTSNKRSRGRWVRRVTW